MSNAPYTTNVAPNLDSLGSQKDNLYYRADGPDGVQMIEIESQSNLGKYRKSLTSRSFSSVGEVLLPNLDFVGNTFIHLKLPQLDENYMLCHNWASAIISSVNYQLGSSNISLVERQGYTMWHQSFVACETKEKRDRWGNLGGEIQGAVAKTGDHEAILQLSLPFSTIRNAMKKSYDTSLLSSPVLIQIHFKPITAILSVSSDIDPGALPQALPTQFSIADVIVRQDVLTNKAESMRNTLMSGDNLFSPYPYVHALSGTTRTFDGVVGQSVTIDMSGYLNSDLLGILFHIVPNKFLNSTIDTVAPGNNTAANPWSTLRARDIKLTFNGSILHDMPFLLHDAEGISMSFGDVDATNHQLNNDGTLIPTTSSGNQYVYYIPFTPESSTVYESSSFPNTPRYSQQPLTISFNPIVINNEPVTFFSTYLYNGVVMTSKGNSNIFFT